MLKKIKLKDYDPPGETRQQRLDRQDREREMLEARSADPSYDWITGQVRARIEDEQ